MRVVLDAGPLTLPSGGLRRYVAELSRALAETFPEDEFVLASDQPVRWPGCPLSNLLPADPPRGRLERRWWLWGLPRLLKRTGAAVFHGTNFEVPYLPVTASVLTLHDLSPWLDRRWHCAAARVRRRTPWLLGLDLATMIITHTDAVRRQAIEYFRLDPLRVVSVPLAAPAGFRPLETPPPEKPYLLYVGALEPRKNLVTLLEAWRHLRRRFSVDLVLAGRRREDFPPLEPEQGLRWLGEVPDEQLPPLYSGALACVYPSCYEGFGLPVLEAMQCGAAVIASRDPAISEVAGEAAVLLDPFDCRAWIEALTAALERPDWTAQWRQRALRRAAQFSWERTAQLTREVYQEAWRRYRE